MSSEERVAAGGLERDQVELGGEGRRERPAAEERAAVLVAGLPDPVAVEPVHVRASRSAILSSSEPAPGAPGAPRCRSGASGRLLGRGVIFPPV